MHDGATTMHYICIAVVCMHFHEFIFQGIFFEFFATISNLEQGNRSTLGLEFFEFVCILLPTGKLASMDG